MSNALIFAIFDSPKRPIIIIMSQFCPFHSIKKNKLVIKIGKKNRYILLFY